MPKEIYNQTDFSGGVNGLDSPRDVVDTQVIRSNSVTFDEKGRIRMIMFIVINSTYLYIKLLILLGLIMQ